MWQKERKYQMIVSFMIVFTFCAIPSQLVFWSLTRYQWLPRTSRRVVFSSEKSTAREKKQWSFICDWCFRLFACWNCLLITYGRLFLMVRQRGSSRVFWSWNRKTDNVDVVAYRSLIKYFQVRIFTDRSEKPSVNSIGPYHDEWGSAYGNTISLQVVQSVRSVLCSHTGVNIHAKEGRMYFLITSIWVQMELDYTK